MKLRASHLLVLVGLVVGGLLVFAIVVDKVGGPGTVGSSSGSEVGTLPPEGTTGTAKIDVAEKFDVGVVPNDKPSKHLLMVYNRGDFDLEILRVDTACPCTTGSIKNKTIPPGGKEPLEVLIRPDAIHGFEATRTLTIESNDKTKPRAHVAVTAHVQPEFVVEPEDADFGNVPKGEIVTKQVRVRQVQDPLIAGKDERLRIEKPQIVGAKAGLTAAIQPVPEDQWAKPGLPEYVVELTADATQLPAGPLQARYLFYTNVPRLYTFSSTLKATVTAPYVVSPTTLTLGRVAPGQAAEAKVRVQAQEPLEISDVTVSGTYLLAEALPTVTTEPRIESPATQSTEGTPYTAAVAFKIAPDAAPGLKREELTFNIKLGGKTYAEKIRVTAAVVSDKVTPGGQ